MKELKVMSSSPFGAGQFGGDVDGLLSVKTWLAVTWGGSQFQTGPSAITS